jgi:hypothetical protein
MPSAPMAEGHETVMDRDDEHVNFQWSVLPGNFERASVPVVWRPPTPSPRPSLGKGPTGFSWADFTKMWTLLLAAVKGNGCTGNDGIQVIVDHCEPTGNNIEINQRFTRTFCTSATGLRFSLVFRQLYRFAATPS